MKAVEAGYTDSRFNVEIIRLFKEEGPKPDFLCKECQQPLEVGFDNSSLRFFLINTSEQCHVCREKKKILENLEDILAHLGISKRFIQARREDFDKKFSHVFSEEGGIFLTGPRGVGKTHLMAALMRERVVSDLENGTLSPFDYRAGHSFFIQIPELLLKIRASFKENGPQEDEIISLYSEPKNLYLDDLGAEKASDWVFQTLYILIDRRYREEKRTVISSNLTLDELSEKLSDRIASRISGMCKVIKIGGKDRRISHVS